MGDEGYVDILRCMMADGGNRNILNLIETEKLMNRFSHHI
jgi:hypothetical protein